MESYPAHFFLRNQRCSRVELDVMHSCMNPRCVRMMSVSNQPRLESHPITHPTNSKTPPPPSPFPLPHRALRLATPFSPGDASSSSSSSASFHRLARGAAALDQHPRFIQRYPRRLPRSVELRHPRRRLHRRHVRCPIPGPRFRP